MSDMPMSYPLSGSPDRGGIDPQNVIPSLNLAGVEGVPPADQVARPGQDTPIHAPDFSMPGMTVPALKAYDLTGPGITYMPAFSAEPMNPDLTDYRHPYGLDIEDNSVLAVDPTTGGRDKSGPYDTPTGLTINKSPLDPDPMVPDLQNPDLTQEVHMSTRPGDLDASALSTMDPATAATVANKDYPAVYMDMRGMNTTRSRHMTLLMDGLHDEEHR